MFKVTKAQILHLLAALIIVPAAGIISTWSMRYLPGSLHLNSTEITAFGLTAMTSALGFCIHWLHGNLWFEKHVAPIVDVQDPPA